MNEAKRGMRGRRPEWVDEVKGEMRGRRPEQDRWNRSGWLGQNKITILSGKTWHLGLLSTI